MDIKLPSDVLFEFGESDLTPTAQAPLDGVEDQVGSAEGMITIEGHTDAVGDDASNQLLSQARAASVQAALQERLGGGTTFIAVGFGESRPVAPNTSPDGGDPDGRAQNRRVEIRTGDMTAAGPPQLEARQLTTTSRPRARRPTSTASNGSATTCCCQASRCSCGVSTRRHRPASPQSTSKSVGSAQSCRR